MNVLILLELFNIYIVSEGDFLRKGRKTRSGILQHFIEPSGGGTNNSQIRVIWSSNLFFVERRRTKKSLHDHRYGLYERAVTFEGPEVYSSSLPIRGGTLSKQIKIICDKLVHHINEVTRAGKRRKHKNVADTKQVVRMVLNFKVDTKGQLWLLYSSSIRLKGSPHKLDLWKGFHEAAKREALVDPLNIENVIRLPPTVKLSQQPIHGASESISNQVFLKICPSCMSNDHEDLFHPVPYKTIISHFEKITSLVHKGQGSRNMIIWPPEPDLIRSGGGVGFGPLLINLQRQHHEPHAFLQEEDYLIPPVLRSIHKQLTVEAYRRYRFDPLFLHKQCDMCETCFLSYAKLASTSFQITQPIRLDEDRKKIKQTTLYGKTHRDSKKDYPTASKIEMSKKAYNGRECGDDITREISVEKFPTFPSAITKSIFLQVSLRQ